MAAKDKEPKLYHSKQSDEWSTPQELYDMLDDIFHFTLDPCATSKNKKCSQYFTKETDGLKQDWGSNVAFVNPPYSRCALWLDKACRYKSVVLIPSRTDTRYFQTYAPKVNYITFIKGRLKFGNSKNAAPFPSCLLVFNIKVTDVTKLQEIGMLIE